MNITRIGTQPSAKVPAEWFTGTVRIDPLFQTHAPARAVGASVTFESGARTALAYSSVGTDAANHRWLRMGSALRRSG